MTEEPDFKFVSESIKPVTETIDTSAMAVGAPGIPGEFTWKGSSFPVVRVLKTWKDTSPCKHGGSEVYVRKHWFLVETIRGKKAKIYFERQARSRNIKKRWWLHSIEEETAT